MNSPGSTATHWIAIGTCSSLGAQSGTFQTLEWASSSSALSNISHSNFPRRVTAKKNPATQEKTRGEQMVQKRFCNARLNEQCRTPAWRTPREEQTGHPTDLSHINICLPDHIRNPECFESISIEPENIHRYIDIRLPPPTPTHTYTYTHTRQQQLTHTHTHIHIPTLGKQGKASCLLLRNHILNVDMQG